MSARDAGFRTKLRIREREYRIPPKGESTVDQFTSSRMLALITLAFLEIVLGVFRSESYIAKAQETASHRRVIISAETGRGNPRHF
jgi:hypothetical protein